MNDKTVHWSRKQEMKDKNHSFNCEAILLLSQSNNNNK